MKKIKIKSEERQFVIGCSKNGVLEFKKSLYKKFGFSDEEIEKFLERDSEELQEGYYSIDKNGINYHGKNKY